MNFENSYMSFRVKFLQYSTYSSKTMKVSGLTFLNETTVTSDRKPHCLTCFYSELSETEVALISIFVSLCNITNIQGTQKPQHISLLYGM